MPRLRSWIKGLGLIGAGAVLLFIAFLVGRWTGATDPNDTEAPTPLVIDLGRPGIYLALGDSYSAGEGLPTYKAGTEDLPQGDRCHRSDEWAYASQLNFLHKTELGFRACSGAVVDNVLDVIQFHDGTPNHLGLQIESDTLSNDVVLVTLTMGGNDVDFADVLFRCAFRRSCIEDPYRGFETLDQWVNNALESLRDPLVDLYQRLRQIIPSDARVLVIGYPPLFPETAPGLFDRTPPPCQLLSTLWGRSEREAIRRYGLELNNMIRLAASEASIEYVDVYAHFSQHGACATGGQWVAFVGTDGPRDGWFHPTRVGQGMFARIVSCYLRDRVEKSEAPEIEMGSCVADHYPTNTDPAALVPPPPSDATAPS